MKTSVIIYSCLWLQIHLKPVEHKSTHLKKKKSLRTTLWSMQFILKPYHVSNLRLIFPIPKIAHVINFFTILQHFD